MTDQEENLEYATLVHKLVSSNRDFVNLFDKALNEDKRGYVLPRELIETLRSILDANADLISMLYEGFEEVCDISEETMSKYILNNLKKKK